MDSLNCERAFIFRNEKNAKRLLSQIGQHAADIRTTMAIEGLSYLYRSHTEVSPPAYNLDGFHLFLASPLTMAGWISSLT